MKEERKSMIKDDGALLVSVPANKATWFDVLTYTRVTNSNNGGWNSKTHWENSLTQLHDKPEILENWTNNSLELSRNNDPKPRTMGFRFGRDPSGKHDTVAGIIVENGITEASENTLIRALYERTLIQGKKEIKLLGYEIPLSSESTGQLKVDLYGWSKDEGGRIEIVEMKKAKNAGDSPLFAFTELICYTLQSIRCWNDLEKEIPKTPDMPEQLLNAPLPSFGLTIAAPEEYWNYWGSQEDRLNRLTVSINSALRKSKYKGSEVFFSQKTLKNEDYGL